MRILTFWVAPLACAFAAAVLAGGCVPQAAIIQARGEIVINSGHAADSTLPVEAREIGADNADAWAAQLYGLDGTKLPSEVVARMRARGDLPEGYED